MTRKLSPFVGAFALMASPALAHHPGSASNTGGAGPIITISASTLEAGHGAVAFLYETIKFGGLGDAELIAAAGKHIHAHSIGTIQSASLGAAYGVTDDFMVSVRIPWVLRTDIREGHHEHLPGGIVSNTVDDRGDSSGFGDVTVLGQYRFLNNQASRTEAAFLFGVKAPTGATDRIDQQGLLFEAEFQPGSGSWDFMLGTAFTQRFGAWSFDVNVLGVLVGTGTQDTKLGDRFLYNAAVSYRLVGYTAPEQHASLPSSALAHGPVSHRHAHPLETIPATPQWTVDAILELNGEWHDFETTSGVRDPNSGGHVLLLSPGVRIARGAFSGFATFGIPIVNEMNGLQSKTRYRMLSGIAYAF
ncbi:MAG: transporter [Alphaproteobacteria bacterium]|nr:MAG: transporter [Alphaproteobacteria bacterium]